MTRPNNISDGNKIGRVLVTGGAGYVGSRLVPALLQFGYQVTVLDLYLYGHDVFDGIRGHDGLVEVEGDLRDKTVVDRALEGCDAVVHLACISNDPSFELDPELGKSINLDSFRPLVRAAKRKGVQRFIYASSSSVYGVKTEPTVTEDLVLEPLTDYSRFKADCEIILMAEREPGFAAVVLRPATVCGYAPRLRLDVVVNIFARQAIGERRIMVLGGKQKRPNIHIDDMVDLYIRCLECPADRIDGRIFNAGCDNLPVSEIADVVCGVVGDDVTVDFSPSNDQRSYHISSEYVRRELGFVPKRSIEDAVRDLNDAFNAGKVPDAATDPKYYNILTMQELGLK